MNSERLDGWKAIAAYLHLSARQCQRLAKTAGLPVRHRGGTRAVYAEARELDHWIRAGNVDGGEAERETSEPETRGALAADGLISFPEPREDQEPTPVTGPVAVDTTAYRRRALVFSLPTIVLALSAVVLLTLGYHWWRTWSLRTSVLTGSWHRVVGGYDGHAAGAGLLETGHWVGPGSEVSVELEPRTSHWAGGIEIAQDRLHRTLIALSPGDRLLEVQRMPDGELTVFVLGPRPDSGPLSPLVVRVADDELRLRLGSHQRRLPLRTHDVRRGRLLLAVGRSGNEYLPTVPGSCVFGALSVDDPVPEGTGWQAPVVPPSRRATGSYVLTVDNVDDQVDVLVDGKRVVTGAFREHVHGFDLGPFLTPGGHTLTARVFNRKWTTTYGVRLTVDGRVVWDEHCGQVNVHRGECRELGGRTGLVRTLDYHFTAR